MNANPQFPIPNSQEVGFRPLGSWTLGVGSCAVVMALSGVAHAAHHSLAGMYDQSRRVALDGIVAQFHYVNPHPYVVLDVKDASGRTQQWRLEMDNRRELADIGITSNFDNGTLVVDEDVLAKALQDNFDDVGQIFASENGFGVQLQALASSYLDADGFIDVRTDGIQKSIDEFAASYESGEPNRRVDAFRAARRKTK